MQKTIALVFASAFAAIILSAGTLSVTPAFAADSCRYLEEPELGNCLLRKAYKQRLSPPPRALLNLGHELNTEIDEECGRGGCGNKAKKLQEKADDNAANALENQKPAAIRSYQK
jgi:hypothetical protein